MPSSRRALVLALCLVSGNAAGAESPQQVARDFYDHFVHPRKEQYGLPEYLRVQYLLGLQLKKALEAQHKYEQACARIAPPNSKPYMLDQNPFFEAADGANAILGVSGRIKGET